MPIPQMNPGACLTVEKFQVEFKIIVGDRISQNYLDSLES
jgi:hypothetical protein